MVRVKSFTAALLSMLLLVTVLSPVTAGAQEEPPDEDEPRVLVFSRTTGFRHASIPSGIAAIEQLGEQHGFEVETTEDPNLFTSEYLADFDAVIWLSTTGNSVLNAAQQAAFEEYVQSGGGFVGIHSAADTHYNWEWYGGLVGGYFQAHPPGLQTADVWVTDQAHPSTEHLPSVWTRHDEWYDYQANPRGDVHVLAYMDESSYEDQVPGSYNNWMGHNHPIAWCHEYDGGRSWYTGGGHTHESFTTDTAFREHMVGGILWAAGAVEGDCGGTVWDNYEKVILDDDVVAPTVVEIANDGRVFYVEMDGRIRTIDPDTEATSTALTLSVVTGNEYGMLGFVLDPDFDDNGLVYVTYTPSGSEQVNRLSQFTWDGNEIDPDSEVIMMTVPVDRSECCHQAGDLEFGPDGALWISWGDDTNPFASNSYTPIDERPGREPWDAQRTSSNTADLRGKLLKIYPQPDGSYETPDDNLFTSGEWDHLFPDGEYNPELGLPEIHSMGLRNPYRFSVDQTTGVVYLSDYGPDANSANPDRGPQNQVTWHIIDEPQNLGWPYCKGPNLAYVEYTFPSGPSGDPFDCDNPVNQSPNNTGLTELPPTTPATVWYSYAAGDDFPMLAGGAPMNGPRYEYDPDLAVVPRYAVLVSDGHGVRTA